MIVGQIQVCSDAVYMCVNRQGTIEKIMPPRKWHRRLQLALLSQLGSMSLQDVRDFCRKHQEVYCERD